MHTGCLRSTSKSRASTIHIHTPRHARYGGPVRQQHPSGSTPHSRKSVEHAAWAQSQHGRQNQVQTYKSLRRKQVYARIMSFAKMWPVHSHCTCACQKYVHMNNAVKISDRLCRKIPIK